MDRQLELCFRLFCLGQLFETIRPYLIRSLAYWLETEGLGGGVHALGLAHPPARWLAFLLCLAVVIAGPRRGLVAALAGAHALDVAGAVWTDSLSSGYAEKGLLLIVSAGVAGLLHADAGTVSERSARMRLFLRVAAGIAFAFIALNKSNADFLVPGISCARDLAQRLVETLSIPEPLASALLSRVWPALAAEALLLPLLLGLPRVGVLYAWCFFTWIAQVGPHATCFVFMALALVFLPPTDFDALRLRRRPILLGALSAATLSAISWTLLLLGTEPFPLRHLFSRVCFLTVTLTGIGLLAVNLVRRGPVSAWGPWPFRGAPRAAGFVAAGALALLLLNELSPYLGLKTKYSLTMWSNLRVDPGRWNSAVLPEAVRVFEHVDRSLLLVSRLTPLDPHLPRPRTPQLRRDLAPFTAVHGTALRRLRELESQYGPLRFELVHAGRLHVFEGAGPEGPFAQFVAATRPGVTWFDERVMTLGRPQRCLGP